MKALILFLLALPLSFGFDKQEVKNNEVVEVTCPAPTNVELTSQGTGTVSFRWDAMFGATEYKVRYVRQLDSYSSPDYFTGNTSYTFSNLPSGTYDFYFSTVCGSETSSSWIIEDHIVS